MEKGFEQPIQPEENEVDPLEAAMQEVDMEDAEKRRADDEKRRADAGISTYAKMSLDSLEERLTSGNKNNEEDELEVIGQKMEEETATEDLKNRNEE